MDVPEPAVAPARVGADGLTGVATLDGFADFFVDFFAVLFTAVLLALPAGLADFLEAGFAGDCVDNDFFADFTGDDFFAAFFLATPVAFFFEAVLPDGFFFWVDAICSVPTLPGPVNLFRSFSFTVTVMQ